MSDPERDHLIRPRQWNAPATVNAAVPGKHARSGSVVPAGAPLDIARSVLAALRDTHVPRLEAAVNEGREIAATERNAIRGQIRKLDAALAAATSRRREPAPEWEQLRAERDELVAIVTPLLEQGSASRQALEQFIATLAYYAHRGFLVEGRAKPQPVEQAGPALDGVSEEIRQVVILLTTDAALAPAAVELWGHASTRVQAILIQARASHVDAQQLATGEAALAALDTAVVGARASGVIAGHRDAITTASPEASFYQAADVAMGETLVQVDKLYRQANKSFYDLNRDLIDKGTGRDALHAAWNGFNFVYTLWSDVGSIPERIERAKAAGVLQQAATFVDLLRYGVQLCGNVIGGISSMGQALARMQGLKAAELEFASLLSRTRSSKDILQGQLSVRVPAMAVVNGIVGIVSIVSGTLQLIDAVKNRDDRAALAAGTSIAQGAVGIGGAALAASPGAAALAGIAGPASMTLFVWYVTIDALGQLGGTLGYLKRDRKLRAVGLLVDQAARVAAVGRDMAAAVAAMGSLVVDDPTMAAKIEQEIGRRAAAAAADVKTGMRALKTHLVGDSPDLVGGYPDLVDRLDERAKRLVIDGLAKDDPISLTEECQIVFSGIDRMARAAVAKDGPDRDRPGSTAGLADPGASQAAGY